jgi:spermidine synthase
MSTAEQSRVIDRLGAPLFVVAIFASAFLLFVVQPMVGKRILPWFGGAPAVWTLCLAFYQTTLFLGYAYAHLLIRFARPSLQLGIHALVFTCAVVSLPVLPGDAWKQGALGEPSSSILAMLSANVALPFLVLAATGPLVQAWFARRYPDRSPYPLYAVSNFGSLLALLGYPILIEPRLPLSTTGGFWSVAFTCTAAAVLACAALARRDRAGVGIETAALHSAGDPRRPWRVVLWFLLAGSAVVVLMGVTNQLCLNLASVPFLWILPLVAYLASFILCFGSERAYRRAPYVVLMGVALFLCYGGPLWGPIASRSFHDVAFASSAMIAFHLLLLFATCMVLHGELYRLRPPARSLTAFYLFVSGGGALGGIFVGVVAPRIFDRYSELPLGLALAWLAVLASCWHDARGWLHAGVPRWRWGVVGALTLALFAYVGERAVDTSDRMIHEERTFFGVLRVVEGELGEPRRLYSGTTIHGAQFLHSSLRRSATSYYGAITGIGFALQQEGSRAPRRIGVVGLGAGTLAAYGRPGDSFRFYEIDPAVIRVARDEGYFTFLADSEAEIAIVPGDARLSLAEEQTRGATQDFDVLVVDAFNSDAIPVHLLTREAFEIYARALHEGGLLAVHVSNAHLDLVPLVSRAGHSVGMSGLHIDNVRAPRRLSLPAEWIVLSRDAGRIRSLEDFIERRREELRLNPQVIATQRLDDIALETGPLWTDDYSDLFGLLRVRAKRGDLDVPAPARPAR